MINPYSYAAIADDLRRRSAERHERPEDRIRARARKDDARVAMPSAGEPLRNPYAPPVPVVRTDAAEGVLGRVGACRYDAYVVSVGVLDYGDRREYRSPAETFDPRFLASMEGIPITDDHPAGLVSDHERRNPRGVLTNVRRADDGIHVIATLDIRDPSLARVIDAKGAVSLGYLASVRRAPPGVGAELEQYGCRADHLAVVASPRCRSCRVTAGACCL